MKSGYSAIPVRSDGERQRRPQTTFWETAVCVLLAVATPLAACAQEGGRPAEEPTLDWLAPTTVVNLEPTPHVTTDPSLLQLPQVPQGAPDATRNRALEIVQRRDEYAVRRYRQGFFQRLRLSGSWIDGSGDDGLGIGNLDTSFTVAVPLGSFENLLLVTPGFEVDFVNGPTQVDTPARLYDTGVDFMWRKQFNDRWGSMLAVRPAISSDFQTSQDAFRLTGRALATWQWVPERLALLFGIVYLDRNDLPLLPGVGLIWTPHPDWRLDLIFPRPKLARRLVFVPRQREDWVYLGGSLGGRTWAVERPSGVSDQLTLRDYRLYLGWERIVEGGGGLFVEAGIVLGRELEYEVIPLTLSFDNAFLIRGGINY
jgi:hypothetical protein